jgi:hypothetical protein
VKFDSCAPSVMAAPVMEPRQISERRWSKSSPSPSLASSGLAFASPSLRPSYASVAATRLSDAAVGAVSSFGVCS